MEFRSDGRQPCAGGVARPARGLCLCYAALGVVDSVQDTSAAVGRVEGSDPQNERDQVLTAGFFCGIHG